MPNLLSFSNDIFFAMKPDLSIFDICVRYLTNQKNARVGHEAVSDIVTWITITDDSDVNNIVVYLWFTFLISLFPVFWITFNQIHNAQTNIVFKLNVEFFSKSSKQIVEVGIAELYWIFQFFEICLLRDLCIFFSVYFFDFTLRPIPILAQEYIMHVVCYLCAATYKIIHHQTCLFSYWFK